VYANDWLIAIDVAAESAIQSTHVPEAPEAVEIRIA
jgi:hypothetical protein